MRSINSNKMNIHKHQEPINLELDIRDKIVLDLGMKQRPDMEHVSKFPSLANTFLSLLFLRVSQEYPKYF